MTTALMHSPIAMTTASLVRTVRERFIAASGSELGSLTGEPCRDPLPARQRRIPEAAGKKSRGTTVRAPLRADNLWHGDRHGVHRAVRLSLPDPASGDGRDGNRGPR